MLRIGVLRLICGEQKLSKFFKFTATIEIEADNHLEAEKIMEKIQNKGEFPDGSIVDNTFNIELWERKN